MRSSSSSPVGGFSTFLVAVVGEGRAPKGAGELLGESVGNKLLRLVSVGELDGLDVVAEEAQEKTGLLVEKAVENREEAGEEVLGAAEEAVSDAEVEAGEAKLKNGLNPEGAGVEEEVAVAKFKKPFPAPPKSEGVGGLGLSAAASAFVDGGAELAVSAPLEGAGGAAGLDLAKAAAKLKATALLSGAA